MKKENQGDSLKSYIIFMYKPSISDKFLYEIAQTI